jgi:asparagine synthetase B (glutamine-hydrolysing)
MTSSPIADVGAAAPFPLRPVEVVTALVFGTTSRHGGLPALPAGTTTRSALETVVERALVAGPTYVSFSGGRDSSAVLALAAHVARRDGHPPPVPVTLRVEGSGAADEDEWQRLVLRHLGLEDRVVLTVRDELDVVGPVSSAVMRRHGLLWPPNGFMHDLILRECAGGTLLTGGGGDELLDDSTAERSVLVLRGRVRPQPRDVARIAAALLARRAYDARRARFLPQMEWLSAEGNAVMARLYLTDAGPPYQGWSRSVERFAHARSFAALRRGQDLVAAANGARIEHPFLAPEVLAAAAVAGGRLGLGGRTAAMRLLVGDLLPEELVSRRTKASFGDALWTHVARAAACADETLDAVRVDHELAHLLDLDGLRRTWRQPQPPHMTTSLLQAAVMSLGGHLRAAGA